MSVRLRLSGPCTRTSRRYVHFRREDTSFRETSDSCPFHDEANADNINVINIIIIYFTTLLYTLLGGRRTKRISFFLTLLSDQKSSHRQILLLEYIPRVGPRACYAKTAKQKL